MSRYPRWMRIQHQAADLAKVARIVGESEDDTKTYTNTPGGDARKLRGIPAIGRSVRGAIPGTIPGDNLHHLRSDR